MAKKKKVNKPEGEREARNTISETGVDLLKPISSDIFKLGSSEDPCFGKLHDLTDSICRRCGDNELCQAVMGQKLHNERSAVEKKQAFKDLEQPYEKPKSANHEMRIWMKKKIAKKLNSDLTIKRAVKRYGVTKEVAKAEYYKLTNFKIVS